MSFIDSLMDKIRPKDNDGYIDDDYSDDYESDVYEDNSEGKRETRRSLFGSRKVIDGAPQGMQVVTIKPAGIEDSQVICDSLLDGKAVILNMEGIGTELAQRIIDFTLGSIYAIQGNLQKVSKYIFVASPRNVELSGDFMGDFSGRAAASMPEHSFGNAGFTPNA